MHTIVTCVLCALEVVCPHSIVAIGPVDNRAIPVRYGPVLYSSFSGRVPGVGWCAAYLPQCRPVRSIIATQHDLTMACTALRILHGHGHGHDTDRGCSPRSGPKKSWLKNAKTSASRMRHATLPATSPSSGGIACFTTPTQTSPTR